MVNKLLDDTVNQRVKEVTIKDNIQMGRNEVTDKQVDLFGEAKVNEIVKEPSAKITTLGESKESQTYNDTIDIANAITENKLFNGVRIIYTGEKTTKEYNKEELGEIGYGSIAKDFKEGKQDSTQSQDYTILQIEPSQSIMGQLQTLLSKKQSTTSNQPLEK